MRWPSAAGGSSCSTAERSRLATVRSRLSPRHVALDVDVLRRESPDVDPFLALIDHEAARKTWEIQGKRLTERVSRFDKAAIRRRLIERIREVVTRAGGVWARLSPYPHPYRSAFNFRADLDEPCPDDYFRFARALKPLDVLQHPVCRRPTLMGGSPR